MSVSELRMSSAWCWMGAVVLAASGSAGCAIQNDETEPNAARVASAVTLAGPGDDAWGGAWVDGTYPTASSIDARGRTSTLGAPTATRVATGWFNVDFPGISGSGGNVQLNSGTQHCRTTAWYPVAVPVTSTNSTGVVTRVSVSCVDLAGAPVNGAFYVLFQRRTHALGKGIGGAYLWNDLVSSSGTPSGDYTWSSTGGAVTSYHQATGVYAVVLGGHGLAGPGGAAFATPHGTTAAYCNAQRWNTIAARDMQVDVACFDRAGAPVDSRFSLLFTRATSPLLGAQGGHAWMQNATGPTFLATSPSVLSYSTSGGTMYSLQGSNGYADFVGLPAVATSSGFIDYGRLVVLAAPTGSAPLFCGGGAQWGGGPMGAPPGTIASAQCFDALGNKPITPTPMEVGIALLP